MMEKNEVITITKGEKTLSRFAEVNEFPQAGGKYPDLTLHKLLAKYRQLYGEYNLLNYSAKDRNCQDFVAKCLGILNPAASESHLAFVKQDLISVFSSPLLRKFVNTITDIGAIARRKVYNASSYMPGTMIQLSLREMREIMTFFYARAKEEAQKAVYHDPDYDGSRSSYKKLYTGYEELFNELKVIIKTKYDDYYESFFDEKYMKTEAYNERMNCSKLADLIDESDDMYEEKLDAYMDSHETVLKEEYIPASNFGESDIDYSWDTVAGENTGQLRKEVDYWKKTIQHLRDKEGICYFVHNRDHTYLVPNDMFNKIIHALSKIRRSDVSDRIITLMSDI